jgi:O-antigen/teichoic acid export membrane protein
VTAGGAAGGDVTRGSAIRLAAEVVSRLLGMATFFLAAVGLGVERFGTLAALAAAAGIVAQGADLGLQGITCPALVSRRFSLATLVRAKLVLTAAVALVAGGALLLPGDAWPVFALLLAAATLNGWVEFLGVALRAQGAPLREALVLVALRACTLAFVVLALSRGAGLPGVAWAELGAAVVPVAAAVVLLADTRRVALPPQRVAEALRAAMPLAVNSVLALTSLRLETLVLFVLRGPAESGAFAAALKVVEAAIAVPGAISAGALPALTREALDLRGDVARRRTAHAIALLAVPAGVGLALTAPLLMDLLGAGYLAGAAPLRVLAAALPFMFSSALLLHGLIAAGRADRVPWLTAARLGVAAVLAAPLIALAGVRGGALGFLAGEVVLFVLARRECRRVGFAFPLGTPVRRALVAALPMAALVAAWPGGLVWSALLGAAAYAGTLALGWRRLGGRDPAPQWPAAPEAPA